MKVKVWCEKCKGRGIVLSYEELGRLMIDCPKCGGYGYVEKDLPEPTQADRFNQLYAKGLIEADILGYLLHALYRARTGQPGARFYRINGRLVVNWPIWRKVKL